MVFMRKSLLALLACLIFTGCSNAPNESPVNPLIKDYRGPWHILSVGQSFETLGYRFVLNEVRGDSSLLSLFGGCQPFNGNYSLRYGELYNYDPGDENRVSFGIKKQVGHTLAIVVDSSSVFQELPKFP